MRPGTKLQGVIAAAILPLLSLLAVMMTCGFGRDTPCINNRWLDKKETPGLLDHALVLFVLNC